VGDRLAALGADDVDHLLGRGLVVPLAVDAAAQVVDDDLGALAGREDRRFAPDAASAAGDQYDPAVEQAHVASFPDELAAGPRGAARFCGDFGGVAAGSQPDMTRMSDRPRLRRPWFRFEP